MCCMRSERTQCRRLSLQTSSLFVRVQFKIFFCAFLGRRPDSLCKKLCTCVVSLLCVRAAIAMHSCCHWCVLVLLLKCTRVVLCVYSCCHWCVLELSLVRTRAVACLHSCFSRYSSNLHFFLLFMLIVTSR